MNAAQVSVKPLFVLAPCAVLPSEGDEIVAPVGKGDDSNALLRAYQSVASSSAPAFVLKNNDVAWQGDIEEHSALQLIDLMRDEESGGLVIQDRYAMSRINWADVMSATSAAISDEHFIATLDELLRVFATSVRDAARNAAAAFAGDAVPLLSVERDTAENAVTVRFLGVWLATDAPATSSGDGLSCVLFDQEAEGRGLKEMAIGAAMLAMVFQGTATAGDAPRAGQQKTSWLASLFSGGGERGERGEVLKVTSQKLVQAPPRVYRNVLENPDAGKLKVVIDIADQRAFLLRGGEVAFETPISTGQGATWTPRGTFTITEKVRSGKMSTIYKCPLPGWMRVGDTKVGMHEGMLPGYPASHGCIRMPIESAHLIFDHAPKGTTVQIVDHWSPPALEATGTMVAQR